MRPWLVFLLLTPRSGLGRSSALTPGLLIRGSRLIDRLVLDPVFEELTPLREQVRANVFPAGSRGALERVLLWPKLLSVLLAGWSFLQSFQNLKAGNFGVGALFAVITLESSRVGFNCGLRRYHSLVLTRAEGKESGLHLDLLLTGTWLEALVGVLTGLGITPMEALGFRWHERGCDPLDWNCIL